MNRQQKLEKGLASWPNKFKKRVPEDTKLQLIRWKPLEKWTAEERAYFGRVRPKEYAALISRATARKLLAFQREPELGELRALTTGEIEVFDGTSWLPYAPGASIVSFDAIIFCKQSGSTCTTVVHSGSGGMVSIHTHML